MHFLGFAWTLTNLSNICILVIIVSLNRLAGVVDLFGVKKGFETSFPSPGASLFCSRQHIKYFG